MAVLFELNFSGSSSVGSEAWLDLGLIPTGQRLWIGSAQWTSVSKAITFSIRGNLVTKFTGTLANTALIASGAPKVGATLSQDLYKNGRLHTVTVVSTGVEHLWLYLKAKSATSGNYLYKIFYTTEVA